MPNADSNSIERLEKQVSGIDFRLHSVEGESDDHESDFVRFTEKFKQIEARLDHLEASRMRSMMSTETDAEIAFEVIAHVSTVKSVLRKRLYDLDPETADTIWRAVDGIQQLTEHTTALELATAHPM